MKIASAFLLVVAACTASVFAFRESPSLTTEQLVSQSQWIFAGRILNFESSPSEFAAGANDVKLTVLAGLSLRGPHPRQVVLTGIRGRPFEVPTDAGKVLIFFGGPLAQPHPGIDGVVHGARPYSDLKQVQALIDQSQIRK